MAELKKKNPFKEALGKDEAEISLKMRVNRNKGNRLVPSERTMENSTTPEQRAKAKDSMTRQLNQRILDMKIQKDEEDENILQLRKKGVSDRTNDRYA